MSTDQPKVEVSEEFSQALQAAEEQKDKMMEVIQRIKQRSEDTNHTDQSKTEISNDINRAIENNNEQCRKLMHVIQKINQSRTEFDVELELIRQGRETYRQEIEKIIREYEELTELNKKLTKDDWTVKICVASAFIAFATVSLRYFFH